MEKPHRSGFVNIVGHPNVGKSTLLNALVGERMSIISNKPQTTRHRIIGLLSGDDFQIVFSDTPGFIRRPAYKMHRSMNQFVASTFEDGDVMLFVTECSDDFSADDELIVRLKESNVPVLLVINKIDTATASAIDQLEDHWRTVFNPTEVHRISALSKMGTEALLQSIIALLPEGPAWYPKDQISDRPERFFVSEIIREKIFHQYRDEIPYASEVVIEHFQDVKTKEGLDLTRISATIYVERETQKAILIGHQGAALKKLGSAARTDIERFLERKVYLETHVKVRDNWRDDERQLKYFGYGR